MMLSLVASCDGRLLTLAVFRFIALFVFVLVDCFDLKNKLFFPSPSLSFCLVLAILGARVGQGHSQREEGSVNWFEKYAYME